VKVEGAMQASMEFRGHQILACSEQLLCPFAVRKTQYFL